MLTGFVYGVFVTYLLGVILQVEALSLDTEDTPLEPEEYKHELMHICAWPIISVLMILNMLIEMFTTNKGDTQ